MLILSKYHEKETVRPAVPQIFTFVFVLDGTGLLAFDLCMAHLWQLEHLTRAKPLEVVQAIRTKKL
jgi:hypothetical protein